MVDLPAYSARTLPGVDPLVGCLSDQVQMALALADPSLLKSLLTDCVPPIAPLHQIGDVSAMVGVSITESVAIDAIIRYESIHCVLAPSHPELQRTIAAYSRRNGNSRGYLDLTRYESETQTLGEAVTLAQAIALLHQAGFATRQVTEILHLPSEAWHKSWWYSLDESGEFTVPFLRLLRTRHYCDGTYTMQYKDFFAYDKPVCFKSQTQQVMVVVGDESLSFREITRQVNYAKQQLDISQVVLMSDRISAVAAKALMNQNIHLYTRSPIQAAVEADCTTCANHTCPLQHRQDSPVLMCRQFCLDAELL